MPNVTATTTILPAGGGDYCLPSLTLGIFLNDQPDHRFAHGVSSLKHRPLVAGQGWLLPSGSDGSCTYDADLEVVLVSLDGSLLSELGIEGGFEFKPVVGALDPLLVSLGRCAADLEAKATLYRETMQRALAAHIVETVRPAPTWQGRVEDRRLRKVLDYIHDNLGADLSLTVMAGLAAMSAAHFSKAFKRDLGQSPLQYVIAARLDQARVMLQTTQLSVAEIAWRCGYQDVSRFGQHLKRRFGATPAALRAG